MTFNFLGLEWDTALNDDDVSIFSIEKTDKVLFLKFETIGYNRTLIIAPKPSTVATYKVTVTLGGPGINNPVNKISVSCENAWVIEWNQDIATIPIATYRNGYYTPSLFGQTFFHGLKSIELLPWISEDDIPWVRPSMQWLDNYFTPESSIVAGSNIEASLPGLYLLFGNDVFHGREIESNPLPGWQVKISFGRWNYDFSNNTFNVYFLPSNIAQIGQLYTSNRSPTFLVIPKKPAVCKLLPNNKVYPLGTTATVETVGKWDERWEGTEILYEIANGVPTGQTTTNVLPIQNYQDIDSTWIATEQEYGQSSDGWYDVYFHDFFIGSPSSRYNRYKRLQYRPSESNNYVKGFLEKEEEYTRIRTNERTENNLIVKNSNGETIDIFYNVQPGWSFVCDGEDDECPCCLQLVPSANSILEKLNLLTA